MAKLNNKLFDTDFSKIDDEDFLVEVEVAINRIMAKKGIKKVELAEKLGVSKARVSQLLSYAGQNMTLKTLASIFTALDEKVEISSETLQKLNEQIDHRVRRREELRIQSEAQCTWLQKFQKDDYEHAGHFNMPKDGHVKFVTEFQIRPKSVRRVAA